jgi:hypothetical protein
MAEGLRGHDKRRGRGIPMCLNTETYGHRRWFVIATAFSVCLSACQSEPITDERVSQTLARCCAELRARVEAVEDRQSAKFRDHCDACRVGAGKKQCESGATAVVHAAMAAFPSGLTPVECTTLHSSLAELGVSIPQVQ